MSSMNQWNDGKYAFVDPVAKPSKPHANATFAMTPQQFAAVQRSMQTLGYGSIRLRKRRKFKRNKLNTNVSVMYRPSYARIIF